jgi:phosphoribosylamine---glycine ligase
MKYCVIGSGGREHAISWRLLHDGSAQEVYVLPGNGGIEAKYRVNIDPSDHLAVKTFCIDKGIDMVVVGPEVPLVDGLVDYLDREKIPAFGPRKNAAMLEGSKIFSKQIMEKYKIPTARHREFQQRKDLIDFINKTDLFPLVIKLDGLAAGKGVGVVQSVSDAMEFINGMVKENSRVFIEDFIDGEEASVLGISDGETVLPMVAVQDHKRAYDGDKGPNTGGMGAYAPAPVMTRERLERVCGEVLVPTIQGMKQEGTPFKGVLYAGIIVKGDDIKVLEFNARFGDPETQVILPLLKNRLGDVFEAAVSGALGRLSITFEQKHAITVVMASGGYPGNYLKGKEIHGLGAVEKDILVFHAGTAERDGRIYTNGGRVLNITALGLSLSEARDRVHGAIDRISFEGAFCRRDIGYKAIGI